MSLELAYFYGSEAEQYSFYRIPKVLLTDQRYKSVSMEAKVLYGLMLDRMGYPSVAVRLFKELDKSGGIGLIERRKQGQGKPARIYVKNFTLPPDPEKCTPALTPEVPSVQTSEKPKSALLTCTLCQGQNKK